MVKKKHAELGQTLLLFGAAILFFYLILTGVAVTTKTVAYNATNVAVSLSSDTKYATITLSGVTYGQLASKGFNYLEIYLSETKSTASATLNAYWSSVTVSFVSPTDSNVVYSVGTFSVPSTLKGNATFYVDPVSFALWVSNNGLSDKNVVIKLSGNNATGSVAVGKLQMYTVSKQTLMNALLQPVAPIFSGFVGAVVAAWNRLRDWLWGALGGGALGTIFAGLFENPWVAALLAIAVILFFYWAFGGKKRRRR